MAGIALVPDDKEFRAQLDKLSANGVASPATSTTSAKTVPTSTNNTSKVPAAKQQSEEIVDMDTTDVPGNTETFRGYKKTSDGKTTTFFNNELDETTRALIGCL